MSDRDDHNPDAPDQAHAVRPVEEAQAPPKADDSPAREGEGPDGADQPGPTGAAGPAAQPPAQADGDADATPAEALENLAGLVADEAADSIDQADDEIGRLIAEVESLTGSDDPPPAEAPAGDEAPSAEVPDDSPRSEEVDGPTDGAGKGEPSEGGGSGGPALTEIDEVLAKDVEQLLDGSFEVVSGVLDDVFDEHAIAVKEEKEERDDAAEPSGEDQIPRPVDAGGGEQPPPAEPGEQDENQLDALTGAAVFESVEEVVGAEDPVAAESTAQAAMETEARTGTAPPPAADSSAKPVPEAVEGRVAASDAEPAKPAASKAGPEGVADAAIEAADGKEEVEAESAGAEPAAHVSELLPRRSSVEAAPAREAASAPGAAPSPDTGEAAAGDEPVEAAPAGGLQLLLSSVIPMVLPVLQAISYPLRFVPPSFRPVVDWVALSLVFWVPIVWIVALFLIGR